MIVVGFVFHNDGHVLQGLEELLGDRFEGLFDNAFEFFIAHQVHRVVSRHIVPLGAKRPSLLLRDSIVPEDRLTMDCSAQVSNMPRVRSDFACTTL